MGIRTWVDLSMCFVITIYDLHPSNLDSGVSQYVVVSDWSELRGFPDAIYRRAVSPDIEISEIFFIFYNPFKNKNLTKPRVTYMTTFDPYMSHYITIINMIFIYVKICM